MGNDKNVGKQCTFLSKYVSVHIQYCQNSFDNLSHPVKSCNELSCNNAKCSLSKDYMGDRLKGIDCIDESPKKARNSLQKSTKRI